MNQPPRILLNTSLITLLFSFPFLSHTIAANEDVVELKAAKSTFVERLLSYDRNEDGQLQRSELAGKNREKFDAWDYDRNGVLDQDELDVLIYFEQNGELPEGKLRSRIESSVPDEGLQLEDGYYRRSGASITVGEFVGRALTFDEDDNGLLDKGELIKMAEAFVQVERLNRARRHQANRLGASSRGLASSGGRAQNQQGHLSGIHSQVPQPIRSRRSPRSNNGTRGGST